MPVPMMLRLAGTQPGLFKFAQMLGGTAAKGAATKAATQAAPSLGRMAAQALLTPGGMVTAGLGGLGIASGIQGLRKAEQTRILDEGKVDGKFDTGIYSAILGLNDPDRLNKLATNRQMKAFGDDQGIQALTSVLDMAGDTYTLDPDKSVAANRAALAPLAKAAQIKLDEEADDRKLYGKRESLERELARQENRRQDNLLLYKMNQDHQARMDNLSERIAAREGNQALQRLQLTGVQDLNREKMDIYRQQLEQKSADDRYRTTAGLISGLATLGSAFAL